MPIYEYRCGECRKTFERIVLSAAGGGSATCPRCGATKAEKLVSRFATAAKGAGSDDFGSGGDDLDGEDWGEGGDFGGGGPGDGLDDEGMGGSGDEGPWEGGEEGTGGDAEDGD